MAPPLPNTTVIEIVETRSRDADAAGGLIKPDEVRINGMPLWVPRGESIEVHGVKVNGPDGADDVVQVTLTLYARRVFLGHASESPEQKPEPTDGDGR